MKKTTLAAVTALTTGALAVPAFAGNITPPPAEPVITTPTPVSTYSATDWTGGFVGGQIGYGDLSGGGLSGDGVVGGVTAGYDYDFGNFVLGGAVDYSGTDITIGGNDVDSLARLKVRGGYDTGMGGLVYGQLGAVRADVANVGDDTGYLVGVGYEHMLNDNVSVKGEVNYHEFENFANTGVTFDATTAEVGVNFRF